MTDPVRLAIPTVSDLVVLLLRLAAAQLVIALVFGVPILVLYAMMMGAWL